MQLLQKGIVLNSNQNGVPGQGLTYKFTGLNSIKPDMIRARLKKLQIISMRSLLSSVSATG